MIPGWRQGRATVHMFPASMAWCGGVARIRDAKSRRAAVLPSARGRTEGTDLPKPLGAPRRSGSYRDKGKVDGHDLKGKVPGLEAAVETDLSQVADYWRRREDRPQSDHTARNTSERSTLSSKKRQNSTNPNQTPRNNQPESSFGCHHVVRALDLLCSTRAPSRLLPSGSQMVQRPGIRRRQPA
jgi:hypothetical protein